MSSYFNIKQWEAFKGNAKAADSFFLGNLRSASSEGGAYNEYGKMVLKNCRFYTRPLSDTEIKLNYDTRLAYDEDNN